MHEYASNMLEVLQECRSAFVMLRLIDKSDLSTDMLKKVEDVLRDIEQTEKKFLDPSLITKLSYFGTSLDSAGHYFFELKGDYMKDKGLCFPEGDGIHNYSNWPFNPEELLKQPRGTVMLAKGTVKYFRIGAYAICAIEGSPKDVRSGTKSVFFTSDYVRLGDLKDIIMSIPIARQIIEKMPFEVAW